MVIPKSPTTRYTVVVGLVACALVTSLRLKGLIEPNFSIPFLAIVLAVSWYLGQKEGILAAVLGTVALDVFFISPKIGITLASRTEAARLLTFFVSALAVVFLASTIRRNRMWLEATLSNIGDAVVVTDKGGCISFLNPVAEGMTGWSIKEARNKNFHEVLNLQDEKSGEDLDAPVNPILAEGRSFLASANKILVSRDGHKVWVEESGSPIRDERGKVIGAILIFRDMTSRREHQDQLSQSQKMDAIGRLAGGVAGDFNNLLTVITGYSEMLQNELPKGNPLHRFANEIFFAADRAAGLSRQLLALGRGQAGRMQSLDLNTLVGNMEVMLKRLLGARVDLVIIPSPGAGKVRADAAQMEQVVMNLAMNSRDAMPDGGKFVIEISNQEIEDGPGGQRPGIESGSYVMIAVSDTGTGMDAETRTHMFEPLFTTKKGGAASGLGLSIVYGIVQQSRGHINVYSQLGTGTIVEIYLPLDRNAQASIMRPVFTRNRRGTETVLVVDDEEGVRKLIHSVLATNGYNVVEAADGKEALAAFALNQSQIALVVTDIVMPHMTGFELGERLTAMVPDLRVLYISGYRDSPTDSVGEERDRTFLQKPFTPDVLLTRVRELLDRPVTK
jgi:two-component system, cell cycle sensor histidine kinase and response regulator CckA